MPALKIMQDKDIAAIYANKNKYIQELDETSIEYQRLLIETLEWKIPNLIQVVPAFFRTKTVTEIGCFSGHLIGNISINGKNDFKRSGYDINTYAIKKAQAIYPDVNFYCGNVFDTDFEQDLLILSDIVEHIEDDLEFLKNCRKVSKNILLNLPLEKSFSQRKRKYGFDDPSGHLRAYNLRDAKNLIRRSGYRIKNMHVVCVVDSAIYQKIKELKSFQENNSTNKILIKKSKLKSLKKCFLNELTKYSLFNKFYYGANLFAFLEH